MITLVGDAYQSYALTAYCLANNPVADIYLVHSQDSYKEATRVAKSIGRRNVNFIQVNINSKDKLLKIISRNDIVCCGRSAIDPLAAVVMQAAWEKDATVILPDGAEFSMVSRWGVSKFFPPKVSITLETILQLREIKFSLSRDEIDFALAAKIAESNHYQHQANAWLEWVYGKTTTPPNIDFIPALAEMKEEWVRGGWLREYTFHLVRRIDGVSDIAHSIYFSNKECTIDVAATVGHRLIVFTCTLGSNCVNRALTVYAAATRLTGDPSLVSLVIVGPEGGAIRWAERYLIDLGVPVVVVPLKSLANETVQGLIAERIDPEERRKKEYAEFLLRSRERD